MSKDPYRYFRIEARELADTLEKGIVLLEAKPDPSLLREMMRASHTLKGAAGVVRHAEIARLAHAVEDRLEAKAPADTILPLVDAITRELATLGAPRPDAARARSETESVRLDLAEVDALLASLANLSARISALRTKTGAEREAMLDGLDRVAHDALEDAQRLRLLPAETLFAEIVRAAHDAATREGRPIEVETVGGERRLDAHVLGLVRDALLQLVRNAIAHGIEPADERTRAGKPATGRIVVSVDVRGPRAIIACRDDGRGLDLDAMRTLAPRGEGANLDATGLVRLAMRAGFTTRKAASELAGRGVGLGVVAATLDRLRGTLAVRTTPGVGTELALEVPVSITAAPALVVEASGEVMTIRLDAIRRTARFAAGDIVRTTAGDALTDGGETYPFAALARVLGGEAASPRIGRAEARPTSTALLLEIGAMRAAAGVDRVLGIANEVVLPLPPSAVSAPMVVGASLDGEGNPRLALDPRLLVDAIAALPGVNETAVAAKRGPARVLVCDDSLTSRMLEQSILEAAGYDVTTAISGEDALEKARAGGFALFIIDVEMPGISGFETVARMRADPAIGGTPAVLVTSRSAAEDKRRGLDAGARAYIVKGEFAQSEFLDTVRWLIG